MTGPAVLDLFSGACGGWSLGMHRAGFRTVAACEIDPWRRAVFSQNFPDVRMYDDVRGLTADRIVSDLGYLPDVIVGSPPCQDASSANTKGKGVDGERTGLVFEFVRIVRECRPRWVALENVPGLRTRGADRVLGALEAIDYAAWPFVVGGDDVGANHKRKRVWIIAFDPAQIGRDGGRSWRHWPHGDGKAYSARSGEDVAYADSEGQSYSAVDAEMGGCSRAGEDAGEPWSHWNGGLARHLRLDDGLSARLATAASLRGRGPKRDTRAGEIVAAFGDAVLPQITESIGRAIWRVEAALQIVQGERLSA